MIKSEELLKMLNEKVDDIKFDNPDTSVARAFNNGVMAIAYAVAAITLKLESEVN